MHGKGKDGPAGPPRFLTVPQTAAMLQLSDATLYRAIRCDEFPAIRVRGRYAIPAKALDSMEEAALARGGVVDAADWVDSLGSTSRDAA
jgi:excisionase family DNA binding protein